MDLLHLGYNNFIPKNKILLILDVGSQQARIIVSEAKMSGKLVRLSGGQKTRAIILTTDGLVLRVALTPGTLRKRIEGRGDED